MENQLSKGLLSADDLMKISWKAFLQRFLKFAYVLLLAVLSFLFVSTILLALGMSTHDGGIILIAVFLDVIAFLVIVLVENIMFYEIVENKSIRIRKAFRRALPKIKPVLGCWATYYLVSLNLLVLLLFLGGFILMSAALVSFVSATQSLAVAFGMLSAFLILFTGVLLMILSILAGIWQRFLFFDVIIKGIPVREALDHSFSLLSQNRQFIFERASVFFMLYILIQLTLTVLAEIHPVFSTVSEIADYILVGWGVMFNYAMYENIKAAGAAEPIDTAQRQSVALLLKGGWVILLTIILLVISFCVFFVVQSYTPDIFTAVQSALPFSLF